MLRTGKGGKNGVIMHRFVARSGQERQPCWRLQKIILADGSELNDTQLGGDAAGKTRYDPDADVKK